MTSEKMLKQANTVKDLAVGMFMYTSTSIFGPLVLFGAIGYFLDKWLGSKPICLIISVVFSFAATNILIFRKLGKMWKDVEKTLPVKPDVEKEEIK